IEWRGGSRALRTWDEGTAEAARRTPDVGHRFSGATPRGGVMGKRKISRRQFLEGTGTVLTVAAAAPALRAQRPAANPVPRTAIALTLNGTARRLDVDDRWTLVEALLGLQPLRGSHRRGFPTTINAELAEHAEQGIFCGFCGFCVGRRGSRHAEDRRGRTRLGQGDLHRRHRAPRNALCARAA